ncbi:helix-turn-helix transcriptional regulator [Haliea sp. E17]|uniref:helix-turn-helix transcriptional regulator n=1 Tax=Haliea sp. E17 TaxID=3401576 RepID=UPI003AAFFFDD
MLTKNHLTVENERSLAIGKVTLISRDWRGPVDTTGCCRTHHLQLSLLPGMEHSRATFVNAWQDERYEPMGQLFLIPAGQTIRAMTDCKQQRSIVCHLRPEAIADWFSRDLEWTDSRLKSALDIHNPRIRALMLQVGEELGRPGFASDAMIELLLTQMLIELYRHLDVREDDTRQGGLSAAHLNVIEERMLDSAQPPSLTELAGLCGISVRHLTRAFRASRGKTVGTYIAEHRIRQAKQLLAAGWSVKATAYEVGFSAPSNFTAAFTRATGESPRAFRTRHARH